MPLVLLREFVNLDVSGGQRKQHQDPKGPGFLMFESLFGLPARGCHRIR